MFYRLLCGFALLIMVMMQGVVGKVAHAATCPAVTAPKIAFDFEPKSPQLDRHRSVRWLNNQHAHNANWFVTGLTSYAMQARFEMRIEPVALGDGRYCLQPALIHPTVSVTEHLVYIASELEKGSCEYDVVYAHEGQHVAINQHMELDIRKALPDFLDQVTDDFARMPPMSARVAPSRIRSLLSKYGLEFKALLAKIDARRQRDHAKIDTAKEYARLSHACGPNSAFQTTLPAAMRR
ncbi:hypothetical protein [Thalassospira profundimaris]|uniref:hypothetical protein n=1 Tax=Thalassospira profundimaris TaxID=502049 RepID=UPI000DEDD148|nr:hypothetical protein [Thalassospira profundimaris]